MKQLSILLIVICLILTACGNKADMVVPESTATPTRTLQPPKNEKPTDTPLPASATLTPTQASIIFQVFFENIADDQADLVKDAINAIIVQKGGSVTLDYHQNQSGSLFICSDDAGALVQLVLAGNLGEMVMVNNVLVNGWSCNQYGNVWNIGNPDGSILGISVGVHASPFEQFFQLFIQYYAATQSNGGKGNSGGDDGPICPPGTHWNGLMCVDNGPH